MAPPAQDPWAAAAAAYKPQSGAAQPSATQKPGEDWKVWQANGGDQSPGLKTTSDKLLGANPVSDTFSSLLNHAKGAVSGLYHSFADAPRNAEEQAEKGTNESSGTVANLLGQTGLGVARMFVNPTRDALRDAGQLRRAGGPQASLTAPSTYDADGNNVPTAGSKLLDAVPIAGPWSRGFADEVHNKGYLPATAGLLTDFGMAEAPGAIARGMHAVAPKLAEAGMGTQPMDRTFGRNTPGKTPGEALLRETNGSNPGAIADQAQSRIDELNKENEQTAEHTPKRLSMAPSRQGAQGFHESAIDRGHRPTMARTNELKNQLTYAVDPEPSAAGRFNFRTDEPIPEMISPRYMMDIKRGVNNLGTAWKAEGPSDLADAAVGHVYHQLDSQLDEAVPGHQERNERMASLIPVAKRAGAADLSAGPLQRATNRFVRPTGALVGAASGAGAGLHAGGIPGALLGGAAGLIAPELLSNPRTLLTGARMLDKAPVVDKRFLLPMTASSSSESQQHQ